MIVQATNDPKNNCMLSPYNMIRKWEVDSADIGNFM